MTGRSAPPSDFVSGLPKCELHVHLEGTLEAGMAVALAERHGLPASGGGAARDGSAAAADAAAATATGAAAAGREAAERPTTFDGLSDFLARYYAAMGGLRTEEDFFELATAYLETAARQGVVYAEMFFDPQAHTARGVPFEAVVTGIRRAQERSREAGGPDSQLIMCFLRDEPVESARATLEASLPFRRWIVGVGLDSDELGHPPTEFAGVFERARAAGYRLTMHCDPRQPDSLAHLWQCLEVVGVERIDHGVECLADERLVKELARRRVGLTVCPLSNLRLYGDLMADAVTEMLGRDLLVTVNSDDPAYFGGYAADNYRAVADAAGLTRAELARLARNGFEAAWLLPDRRAAYLDAVEDYVRAGAATPPTRAPAAGNR